MRKKIFKGATKLLLTMALVGGTFAASTVELGAAGDMLEVVDLSPETVKADIQPAEQFTVFEPEVDSALILGDAEAEDEEEGDEVIIAEADSVQDEEKEEEEEVAAEEVVTPAPQEVVEDVPVPTTTPVVAEAYYPATVQVEIPEGVYYCSFQLLDQNGAILVDYQMVPSCGYLFTSAVSTTPTGTLVLEYFDAAGNYLWGEEKALSF